MIHLLLILCLLFINTFAQEITDKNLPIVSGGKIIRCKFNSAYVDSRFIDIWLPPDYINDISSKKIKKYPVLYFQDGQNLFDSNYTWNRLEWKFDETAIDLINNSIINPFIIVAIHNNGVKRRTEFFPNKVYHLLTDSIKDSLNALLYPENPLQADNYLKFVTVELMPFIDSAFHSSGINYIGGSSSGALISVYGLFEYPNIFAGGIFMSPHWIGVLFDNISIPAAFRKYLSSRIPYLTTHKLYFDLGTEGLDAFYFNPQTEVDSLLRPFVNSQNYLSKVFHGHNHSEASWSERLNIPLTFIFGNYEE